MKEKLESKIPIPKYTLGEEITNAISHGLGSILGIVALTLCLTMSILHKTPYGITSSIVFGLSLIILYTISTIYHALKINMAKRIFRILDHCCIYLLIAGTYTPFTLIVLQGKIGYTLFAIVWISAIIGIVLNALDVEKYKVISMITYLLMGWVVIFAMKPLFSALPFNGFLLLLTGGIIYTIGAIIYGLGRKIKYMHSIWHFFVLIGSILHFLCIVIYVL